MDVTAEILELLCDLDRVTINGDLGGMWAEAGAVLDLGFGP